MHPDHDDGNDDSGGGVMSEWSSTIGIVTAIAGNILISFALNTQRYAHIRLQRDRARRRAELRGERDGPWKHRRATSSGDYGTLTSNGAESQQVQGTTTGPGAGTDGSHENGTERFRNGNGPASHADNNASQSMQSSFVGDSDTLQRSFVSDRTVTSVEKRARLPARKSYLSSPYWWAGLVLMILGEAGNFLAYGFAPASIVSPLGVVALVSNCIIAPFMLKENFRHRDLLGVLIAVGGAVTVVVSAKTSEVKIGPGEIWGMITTWEFETYLGVTIVLILALMWASEKYGRKTILIDLGLVGLAGGYTALSTKGVSSLLSYTLWRVITFPITYALVAVLVFSAMMQIRYLNRALQRFDSTQVIPTQFVIFTISVILGSAILYRDFESITTHQALEFFGGCALTFLGVYLITSGRERVADLDSEAGDEEETIGLLDSEGYRNSTEYTDGGQPVEGQQKSRRASRHLPADEEYIGEEDRLQTPRAQLSRSASSVPSISDASSLIKSRPESPKSLHPTARNEGDSSRAAAEAAPETLEGAQSSPDQIPPSNKVLLRFPSAPGLTDSLYLQQAPQTPTGSPYRASTTNYDTPSKRLMSSLGSRKPGSLSRTPLSLRFSPGPLLSPLPGGLSAVVAERLRRGEGSPSKQKRRRTRSRRRGKRRQTDPTVGVGDRGEDETEYETDDSHAENHEQGDQFGGPLDRDALMRPGPSPSSSPNTQDVVPTLSSTAPGQSADVQRSRSLSDSWSEGLSRFSERFRPQKKKPSEDNIPASPP